MHLPGKRGLDEDLRMGDTLSSEIESAETHAGSSLMPMVENTEFVGELGLAGTTIPCAVLPGGQRIISQRGFMRALGLTHGGKQFDRTKRLGGPRLPNCLAHAKLKPFVGNEPVAVLIHTVNFRHSGGGKLAHGIDARALPLACEAWLKARRAGVLQAILPPSVEDACRDTTNFLLVTTAFPNSKVRSVSLPL